MLREIAIPVVSHTKLAEALHAARGNELIVLMYHRVTPRARTKYHPYLVSASTAAFEQQMEYITRHCKVLSIGQLITYRDSGAPLPKNSVMVTFDDGYRDNYDFAFPILKKYKIPAVISLTTAFVDGTMMFWWDKLGWIIQHTKARAIRIGSTRVSLHNKTHTILVLDDVLKQMKESRRTKILDELARDLKITPPNPGELSLSWQQVQEMHSEGIEFAGHTVHHTILSKVDFPTAKREIDESLRTIERNIGTKVRVFVYPNGQRNDMNDRIHAYLAEKRMEFVLTGLYGPNEDATFLLKRIGMEAVDDMRMFKIKLAGFGASLADLYLRYRLWAY